jgi:two-component system, NarL family, sensor histidine kinase UhpB
VAYRTAQEALTNVAKHSRATAVEIDLSDREGVLTLEVSDNGQGLSPASLQKAQSFGLLGLKERASKVGGWLDVSSSGPGTSVILSIPLANSACGDPPSSPNPSDNHDQGDFV